MKTLNSTIYTLSHKKGVSVKIGSIKGNGLWYCHKLCSHTIQDIDKEYEMLKAKELKLLAKTKTILEDLDNYFQKKYDKWLNNKKIKKTPQKIEKFSKQLEESKQRAKVNLPRVIKELEYDTTHSFLNREVVEIRNGISPDEPNTKVIYVKGYERGDYWTDRKSVV